MSKHGKKSSNKDNDKQITKLSEMIGNMKAITGRSLEVGIISHANDPVKPAKGLYSGRGLTVGELATIHEFGLGNAPIRSIIQEPLESDETSEIIKDELNTEEFWQLIGSGKKGEKEALARVGERLVNRLIDWFASCGEGSWDELSEEYAKRKTRAGYPEEPLHTTLQLMESLEYKVH